MKNIFSNKMFDEPVVFPTEGHYDTAALYFAREKTNVKALGELLILSCHVPAYHRKHFSGNLRLLREPFLFY